jgi:glycosyltransferase involved in cell wall biosynthesis
MNKTYIVIKEYNETLAKRQPWYSVKKLTSDLKSKKIAVEIVPSMNLIPSYFTGNVIKVFSIKDVFTGKCRQYKLFYLMTFPVYGVEKFLSFSLKTTIENWENLKRIFTISLLPTFILKLTLQKADDIIVISDRSEKYLSRIVSTKKYIPFIFNNWDGVKKDANTLKDIQTIGYFGPPFTTRSFDDVINFFTWLNLNKHEFNKKIITRIEREELKDVEDEYLSKIKNDKSLKVVSGFLDRESLAIELLEIDILILPFKIVMSELPVVALEALELGIPIITTEDSGIEEVAKSQKNILVLKDFKINKFDRALKFIKEVEDEDFKNIRNNIETINNIFLNNFNK